MEILILIIVVVIVIALFSCFCTYYCMYIQATDGTTQDRLTVSAPIIVCTYRTTTLCRSL